MEARHSPCEADPFPVTSSPLELANKVGALLNGTKRPSHALLRSVFRQLVSYLNATQGKQNPQEVARLLASRCKRSPLAPQVILEDVVSRASAPGSACLDSLVAAVCHGRRSKVPACTRWVGWVDSLYTDGLDFVSEAMCSCAFIRGEMIQHISTTIQKSVGRQRAIYTALAGMLLLDDRVPDYTTNVSKISDCLSAALRFTDVCWIVIACVTELVRRLSLNAFCYGVPAAGTPSQERKEDPFFPLIRTCIQTIAKNSKAGDKTSVFYGAELLVLLVSIDDRAGGSVKKLQDMCLDTTKQWKGESFKYTPNYKGFSNMVYMIVDSISKGDFSQLAEYYNENPLGACKIAFQPQAGHALLQTFMLHDNTIFRNLAILSLFASTQSIAQQRENLQGVSSSAGASSTGNNKIVSNTESSGLDTSDGAGVSNAKFISLLSYYGKPEKHFSFKIFSELKEKEKGIQLYVDIKKIRAVSNSIKAIISKENKMILSLISSMLSEYLDEALKECDEAMKLDIFEPILLNIYKEELVRNLEYSASRLTYQAINNNPEFTSANDYIDFVAKLIDEYESPFPGYLILNGCRNARSGANISLNMKYAISRSMFSCMGKKLEMFGDLNEFFTTLAFVVLTCDDTTVAYMCSRSLENINLLLLKHAINSSENNINYLNLFSKIIGLGVYKVFSDLERTCMVSSIHTRKCSSNVIAKALASYTISTIKEFAPEFLRSVFNSQCTEEIYKQLVGNKVDTLCQDYKGFTSKPVSMETNIRDRNILSFYFSNTLEKIVSPSTTTSNDDMNEYAKLKVNNIKQISWIRKLNLEQCAQILNIITPLYFILNGLKIVDNNIESFDKHAYIAFRNCLGYYIYLASTENNVHDQDSERCYTAFDFIPYYTLVSYLINRIENGDDYISEDDKEEKLLKISEQPSTVVSDYSNILTHLIQHFGSTSYDIKSIVKIIQSLSVSDFSSVSSSNSMLNYTTAGLSSLLNVESNTGNKKLFVKYMEMIIKGRLKSKKGSSRIQGHQMHEYPQFLELNEVDYSPYFSLLLIEHAIDDPLIRFKAAAVRNELYESSETNIHKPSDSQPEEEVKGKHDEEYGPSSNVSTGIVKETEPSIEDYIKMRMNTTNPLFTQKNSKKYEFESSLKRNDGQLPIDDEIDGGNSKYNDEAINNLEDSTGTFIDSTALSQSTSFPSYMISSDDAHIILKYLEIHPYPSSILLTYIAPILGKFLAVLPLTNVKVPATLTLPKVETEYLMSSNAAHIDKTYQASVIAYGHSGKYPNGTEMPYSIEMPLTELATTLFVRGIFNDYSKPIEESLTQAELTMEYEVDYLSPILKRIKKEAKYYRELESTRDFHEQSNIPATESLVNVTMSNKETEVGTLGNIISNISSTFLKGFEYLGSKSTYSINATIISKTSAMVSNTADSVSLAMTESALSSSLGRRQTNTTASKTAFMNKTPLATCGNKHCIANPMLKPRERYNLKKGDYTRLTDLVKKHKIWDENGNIVNSELYKNLSWLEREFVLLALLNLSGDDCVCSRHPQCEARMLTTACKQYAYEIHMASNGLVSLIQLMKDDLQQESLRNTSEKRKYINVLGDSIFWLPKKVLPHILKCLKACVKGWMKEDQSKAGKDTASSRINNSSRTSGINETSSADVRLLKIQDTSLNSLWLAAALSCCKALGVTLNYIVDLNSHYSESYSNDEILVTRESVLYTLNELIGELKWTSCDSEAMKKLSEELNYSRDSALQNYLISKKILSENTKPFIVGSFLYTFKLDGIRMFGLIGHMKRTIEQYSKIQTQGANNKLKDEKAKKAISTEDITQNQRVKTITVLLVLLKCLRMPMIPYIRYITTYMFDLFGTKNKTINRIGDAMAKETSHAILGTSDVSGLSAQYAIVEIAKTIKDRLKLCSEFDRKILYSYDSKMTEIILSRNKETIKSILKFIKNICEQIQSGYKINRRWTASSHTGNLGSMFATHLYQQVYVLTTDTDTAISSMSKVALLALLNTVTMTGNSSIGSLGARGAQPEADVLSLKSAIKTMLLSTQQSGSGTLKNLSSSQPTMNANKSDISSSEALSNFMFKLYKYNFRQTPSEILQTIACTHLLNTIGQPLNKFTQSSDQNLQDCLNLGSVGMLRFLYEIVLMNADNSVESGCSRTESINQDDQSIVPVIPSTPVSNVFNRVLRSIIAKDIQGSSDDYAREQAIRYIQLYYGSGTDKLHEQIKETTNDLITTEKVNNPMVDALLSSDDEYITLLNSIENSNNNSNNNQQATENGTGYDDTIQSDSNKSSIVKSGPVTMSSTVDTVACQCKGKMLSLYPCEPQTIHPEIHIDRHFLCYCLRVGKGLLWSLSALRTMNRLALENASLKDDAGYVMRKAAAVFPRKMTGILLIAVSAIYEALADEIYDANMMKSVKNEDDSIISSITIKSSLPNELLCALFTELMNAITYVANGNPKLTSSAAATVSVGSTKIQKDTRNKKDTAKANKPGTEDSEDEHITVSSSTTPSGYAIDQMKKVLRMIFRNYVSTVPYYYIESFKASMMDDLKKHDELMHSLLLTCCINCICGCNEGRKTSVELIGETIASNTKMGIRIRQLKKAREVAKAGNMDAEGGSISEQNEAMGSNIQSSVISAPKQQKMSQLNDFSTGSIIRENIKLMGMYWYSLLVTTISIAQFSSSMTYANDIYNQGQGKLSSMKHFLNYCSRMTSNTIIGNWNSSVTTVNSSINSSSTNIFKTMFSNQLEMVHPKQTVLSIIEKVKEEEIEAAKNWERNNSSDIDNETIKCKKLICDDQKTFLNMKLMDCILKGVINIEVLPDNLTLEEKNNIMHNVYGVNSDNGLSVVSENNGQDVLINSLFVDGYLSKHSIGVIVDPDINSLDIYEKYPIMNIIVNKIEEYSTEYARDDSHNILAGYYLLHYIHSLLVSIDGFNSRTTSSQQYQAEITKLVPPSTTSILLHLLKNSPQDWKKKEGEELYAKYLQLTSKLSSAIKNTTTLTIAKMIDKNEQDGQTNKKKQRVDIGSHNKSQSTTNSLENEIIKIVTSEYNDEKDDSGSIDNGNDEILITLMKSNQQIFNKMIQELIDNVISFNNSPGASKVQAETDITKGTGKHEAGETGDALKSPSSVSSSPMIYLRSCKLLGHVISACDPSIVKEYIAPIIDHLLVSNVLLVINNYSGIKEKSQLFGDIFYEVLIRYKKIANYILANQKKISFNTNIDPSVKYEEYNTEGLASAKERLEVSRNINGKLVSISKEKDGEIRVALMRLHSFIWNKDTDQNQNSSNLSSFSAIKSAYAHSMFYGVERTYVENFLVKALKGVTSYLGSQLYHNGQINLQQYVGNITEAGDTGTIASHEQDKNRLTKIKYTNQSIYMFLVATIFTNVIDNIQMALKLSEQELVEVLQTQTAYVETAIMIPASYWISTALENIEFEKFRFYSDPDNPVIPRSYVGTEDVHISVNSIIMNLIRIASGEAYRSQRSGGIMGAQNNKYVNAMLSSNEISKARILAIRLLCKLYTALSRDAIKNDNKTARNLVTKTAPLFMGKLVLIISTANVSMGTGSANTSSASQASETEQAGRASLGWYNGIILLGEAIKAVTTILRILEKSNEKKCCAAFIPSLRSCLTSNKGLLCSINVSSIPAGAIVSETDKVTGTTIRKSASQALGLVGRFSVIGKGGDKGAAIMPTVICNNMNISYASNDSRETTVTFIFGKIFAEPIKLGSPIKIKPEFDSPILERAILLAIGECLEDVDNITTRASDGNPNSLSFTEALFTYLIHLLHTKDYTVNLLASELTGHILCSASDYTARTFITAIFSETSVSTLAAAQLRIAARLIDNENPENKLKLNEILKDSLDKKGWKSINNPETDVNVTQPDIHEEHDEYIYAWSHNIFSNVKSVSYGLSSTVDSTGTGDEVDLIYKSLFELYDAMLVHNSHVKNILQIFVSLLKSSNISARILACESIQSIFEKSPDCLQPDIIIAFGIPEILIDLMRSKDTRLHTEAERALARLLCLKGDKSAGDKKLQAYSLIYRKSGNKAFSDVLITNARHIVIRITKGILFE